MKTIIITVLATLFIAGWMLFRGESEPEVTAEIAESSPPAQLSDDRRELPPEAALTKEARRELWSQTAFERLTTEHRLYLNDMEQRIFQASVLKWLEAKYQFALSGQAKAQDDMNRFAAEIARWERQVTDAKP